ncbi:quinon protein alcohol dehydrogenase-like superfamily [Baffinella frigidus]|nr:quinon protein alcohol dehydrogenase-like superfamily [Cryptophyta sp. CCMP2293]
MLALGTWSGKDVQLVEASTGMERRAMPAHMGVFEVAISNDGAALATAGVDRSWKLWELSTGTVTHTVEMKDSWGECTCVVRSRRHIDIDYGPLTFKQAVMVWDADDKEQRRLLGHTHGVSSVAFSPDGKLLASGGSTDGRVLV